MPMTKKSFADPVRLTIPMAQPADRQAELLPAQEPVAGDRQCDGDRHDDRRRQGQEGVGRHEDDDGDGGVDEPHRAACLVEHGRAMLGDGRRHGRLLTGRSAVLIGRVHEVLRGRVVV
jgi:hypothetical protein